MTVRATVLAIPLAFAVTVLLGGATASATSYSFDVSGTGWAGFDSLVPTSPLPPCSEAGLAVLTCPFLPGSSLQLDIQDDVVTIESAAIVLETATAIGASLVTSQRTYFLSGGHGALSGNTILWSGPAEFSESGTGRCSGPDCAIIGVVEGVDYPLGFIDYWIVGASPLNPIELGTWQLDASFTSILGSTRATTSVVSRIANPFVPLPLGTPMSWLVFGPEELSSVPEPASGVLVVVGLVGLSLRPRSRRSEALRAPQPAGHAE